MSYKLANALEVSVPSEEKKERAMTLVMGQLLLNTTNNKCSAVLLSQSMDHSAHE